MAISISQYISHESPQHSYFDITNFLNNNTNILSNILSIDICCAQDNNFSEESTNQAETDAVGDVTNTTRTENNREKQSTQYLTRFGNGPTSSRQGRERFY